MDPLKVEHDPATGTFSAGGAELFRLLKVEYSLATLSDDRMRKTVCHPLKGDNHSHEERQVICRKQTQEDGSGRRGSWEWYLCVPHGMDVLEADQEQNGVRVRLSEDVSAIQSLWNAFVFTPLPFAP